jgi:hypothetical protein
VVKKPATLAQTIRRLILLTGGSGFDSTTTAGGLPAAFAGTFAGGVAGAFAGGAVTSELGWSKALSTPLNLRKRDRDHIVGHSHFNAGKSSTTYTIPRDTGIDVSVKTDLALFTRSAVDKQKDYKMVPTEGSLYIFKATLASE